MANSQYNYDEEGETWPFFLISVLAMILVPMTVSTIYGFLFSSVGSKDSNGAVKTSYKSPIESDISSFKLKKKSGKLLNYKVLGIVVGWALLVWLAMNTKDATYKVTFDPYEILDVSSSASERDIKSRYRKLSLVFHPDKIANDVGEDEKKALEETFIKINQAYKALTDEDTKKNYLLYGHPDGPQEITHGIALPKFLVEGQYSALMVVFYFILVGVLLPYVVGSWWAQANTYTKGGLHVDTAGLFVRKLLNNNPAVIITPSVILGWALEANEITSLLPKYSQEELKQLVEEYLNRDFSKNLSDKLALVSTLPQLLSGLLELAGSFRLSDVVISTIDLQRSLVQAVKLTGKHQQLLQLPEVDVEAVEKSDVRTLGKLVTLPKDEVKKVLGFKDDSSAKVALSVANQVPILKVVKAEFKVPGESVVPPSSNVHIALKVIVRSASQKGEPKYKEESLKEEDTIETLRNPYKIVEDQPRLPIAYTPYFPMDIGSSWTSLLILQRDSKLADTTSMVTQLDLSNLSLEKEEYLNGEKVRIGTIKVPVNSPTPPQTGKFHFRLLLKNNAYFGSDIDMPIVMTVEQPPQIEELPLDDDEDDVSEPEEDSIAGAMASLRGEKVKKVARDEDSEDENDDSEYEDINTDTEDEDEK